MRSEGKFVYRPGKADREFAVTLTKDEDGRILAVCPTLQGCYTEGETEEEALDNIRETIEAHIESRLQHGKFMQERKEG
jgi:predicted RNase H-like HicB family nuclease